MKLNKTLSLVVLCVLPTVTRSQVYSETSPVDLYFNLGSLASLDTFSMTGTLSETVTIDSTAGTIEQAGTVSIDAANLGTFSASQTQTITIPAQFPNPPQMVQVPGSITIGVASGSQIVSFDTGPVPLNYIAANTWTFNPGGPSIDIPLDLSYSLTTGGQTYTGDLQPGFEPQVLLPSQLNTGSYPTSIELSPNAFERNEQFSEQVLDFTAPNGFVAEVVVTPEPNVAALFGIGLTAFGILRRKR